jgi:hypothetical protein
MTNSIRPICCSGNLSFPLAFEGGLRGVPHLAQTSSPRVGRVIYEKAEMTLPDFEVHKKLGLLDWALTLDQVFYSQGDPVYTLEKTVRRTVFIKPMVTFFSPDSVVFSAASVLADPTSTNNSMILDNLRLSHLAANNFFEISGEIKTVPGLLLSLRLYCQDIVDNYLWDSGERLLLYNPDQPVVPEDELQPAAVQLLLPLAKVANSEVGGFRYEVFYDKNTAPLESRPPKIRFSFNFVISRWQETLNPFFCLVLYEGQRERPVALFSILPHPRSILAQVMMRELYLDEENQKNHQWIFQ